MFKNLLGRLLLGVFLLTNSLAVYSADSEEETGKGSVECTSYDKLKSEQLAQLTQNAKEAAWSTYTARRFKDKPSEMSEYLKIEKEFTGKSESGQYNLDKYITNTTVIDKTTNKDLKRCELVVRIGINEALVNAKLSNNSAASKIDSGEGSTISAIFVAREQSYVKKYDDKKVSMGSAEVALEKEDNVKIKVGSGQDVKTKESAKGNYKSTTGGSTEKKSAIERYKVLATTDFDAAFNQVLTENKFEVTNYEDIFNTCKGTDPEKIKTVFSKQDELDAKTRGDAIAAAKKCEVRYFVIGYMNVSLSEKDPVSGNEKVSVSINGKVFDIAKKLPKQIASVGPVLFFGMGPDQNTARINALKNAATEVAKTIVGQLNSKGIK